MTNIQNSPMIRVTFQINFTVSFEMPLSPHFVWCLPTEGGFSRFKNSNLPELNLPFRRAERK